MTIYNKNLYVIGICLIGAINCKNNKPINEPQDFNVDAHAAGITEQSDSNIQAQNSDDSIHNQSTNNKTHSKFNMDILRSNLLVAMVLNRGILSPNCKWWKINDLFLKDKSGVNFYLDMKKKGSSFAPLNILGKDIYLVTENSCMKQILNNSPHIFGVGKYKYSLFKNFMKGNVGVSQDIEWENKRRLNVKVLNTDKLHTYSNIFNNHIRSYLEKKLPKDFHEFVKYGKEVTSKIVFNNDTPAPDEVFEIFSKANSISALFNKNFKIDDKTMNVYIDYLMQNIDNPQKNSLVYLAVESIDYCPIREKTCKEEILYQIPHWIFPTIGLFHSVGPRLLLMLANHPDVFKKVELEITSTKNINAETIDKMPYLRQCVLEMVRLNNSVLTTFRTLRKDYDFGNGYRFKKGSQFLILNNPVLREEKIFNKPNQFIPERWEDKDLEDSYYALMFNQGPQRCPGKDLAIFIIKSFIVHYLRLSNFRINAQKINTSYIEQMINPCTLSFK